MILYEEKPQPPRRLQSCLPRETWEIYLPALTAVVGKRIRFKKTGQEWIVASSLFLCTPESYGRRGPWDLKPWPEMVAEKITKQREEELEWEIVGEAPPLRLDTGSSRERSSKKRSPVRSEPVAFMPREFLSSPEEKDTTWSSNGPEENCEFRQSGENDSPDTSQFPTVEPWW